MGTTIAEDTLPGIYTVQNVSIPMDESGIESGTQVTGGGAVGKYG